jgi:hypothetical protein
VGGAKAPRAGVLDSRRPFERNQPDPASPLPSADAGKMAHGERTGKSVARENDSGAVTRDDSHA